MTLDSEAAIERMVQAMLAGTLAKAEWTHEAHFALALWLARHRPQLTGPDPLRDLITRYNVATGTANTDTGGYHHTITRASMRAAKAWLAASAADAPLPDVLAGLMASALGGPDWPLAYWSEARLFSVAARRGWCDPDRAALPW